MSIYLERIACAQNTFAVLKYQFHKILNMHYVFLQYSMNAIKPERDSDNETLPVSSASNSKRVDLKQEEHSSFSSLDCDNAVSCSSYLYIVTILTLHVPL
jgi:hypothetical protein